MLKKNILGLLIFWCWLSGLHAREGLTVKEREDICQRLVHTTIKDLDSEKLATVCNKVMFDPEFKKADLFVYIMDGNGWFYAHADEPQAIWRNMQLFHGAMGAQTFKKVAAKIKNGGGWVDYTWNKAQKKTYVASTTKDGTKLIVGCGFYPQNKEFEVLRLLQRGVVLFNERGLQETAMRLNNPFDTFVHGDLYIFLEDFEGHSYANADNIIDVGQNILNITDQQGRQVTRDLIAKARSPLGRGWIEYGWKNATKRSYIQHITDKAGKDYYMGAGYWPEIGRDEAMQMVRRAIRLIKAEGPDAAFHEFDIKNKQFTLGPLSVAVYDPHGHCYANQDYPRLVGDNLFDRKDEDGHLYVKEIVERAAKEGSGWVTYKDRNAYKTVYFEMVHGTWGDFIVASGYYPVSKGDVARILVNRAAAKMEKKTIEQALYSFTKQGSHYIRGDLDLFVLDFHGICLAFGKHRHFMWQDFNAVKTTDNRALADLLIAAGVGGSGWVDFTLNKSAMHAYVRRVDKTATVTNKEGKSQEVTASYLVGVAYYL